MPPFANSDWIALSSAVVAICALGATLWQAAIARRHGVLSVRPHLDIYVKAHPDDCSISLKNDGLGPAMNLSIEFSFRETVVPIVNGADYVPFFAAMLIPAPDAKIRQFVPDKHSAVAAGASLVLTSVSSELYYSELDGVYDEITDLLSIKVTYECLYGNKYVSVFRGENAV